MIGQTKALCLGLAILVKSNYRPRHSKYFKIIMHINLADYPFNVDSSYCLLKIINS